MMNRDSPQMNFPNFGNQGQMQDDIEDYHHQELDHYEEESHEEYGKVEISDLVVQFEEIMTGIQQLQTHVESVQVFANDTFAEYDAAFKLNQDRLEAMQGKMKSQAKLLK